MLKLNLFWSYNLKYDLDSKLSLGTWLQPKGKNFNCLLIFNPEMIWNIFTFLVFSKNKTDRGFTSNLIVVKSWWWYVILSDMLFSRKLNLNLKSLGVISFNLYTAECISTCYSGHHGVRSNESSWEITPSELLLFWRNVGYTFQNKELWTVFNWFLNNVTTYFDEILTGYIWCLFVFIERNHTHSYIYFIFKGPMKSAFYQTLFLSLVLLYWLVWIKNNFKCFFLCRVDY